MGRWYSPARLLAGFPSLPPSPLDCLFILAGRYVCPSVYPGTPSPLCAVTHHLRRMIVVRIPKLSAPALPESVPWLQQAWSSALLHSFWWYCQLPACHPILSPISARDKLWGRSDSIPGGTNYRPCHLPRGWSMLQFTRTSFLLPSGFCYGSTFPTPVQPNSGLSSHQFFQYGYIDSLPANLPQCIKALWRVRDSVSASDKFMAFLKSWTLLFTELGRGMSGTGRFSIPVLDRSRLLSTATASWTTSIPSLLTATMASPQYLVLSLSYVSESESPECVFESDSPECFPESESRECVPVSEPFEYVPGSKPFECIPGTSLQSVFLWLHLWTVFLVQSLQSQSPPTSPAGFSPYSSPVGSSLLVSPPRLSRGTRFTQLLCHLRVSRRTCLTPLLTQQEVSRRTWLSFLAL